MTTLSVYALDRPGVFCHGDPVRFPTKKAQELLYFLLVNAGRMVDRDLIAERLWPMYPPRKSHHSLATALWRLCKVLPAPDDRTGGYLAIRPQAIGFNKGASYWFDAETFEQRATMGLKASLPLDTCPLQALETAVDLYRHDFLDGWCADWCLAKREELQLLLVRVLKRLQCHNRLAGNLETAIAQGQRLLALDPLLEEVHRELMRCYTAAGQRAQALAQYERCAGVLQRELRTTPMAKTTRLYHQIREGQYQAAEPHEECAAAGDVAALRVLLDEFRRVLDRLEPTWQALRVATGEYQRQRDGGRVPYES